MKLGYLKKNERIKKSCDIKKIFENDNKICVWGAKIFFARNGRSVSRIACTFSRNFGNAVKRNRSKRFCREVFRFFKSRLYEGFDIVFFIYPIKKDSFILRYGQFEKLCELANLLKH